MQFTQCLCCIHYKVHEKCDVLCNLLGKVEMKEKCSSFEPDDYAQCYMSATNHCYHCLKNRSDGIVECRIHSNIPYKNRCYDFVEEYSCEKKKKGCFLTTASCEILHKADNCYELETLRNFRDTFLKHFHPELIEEYYEISPSLAQKLKQAPDKKDIATILLTKYIHKVIDLIENRKYEKAISYYREMVDYLQNYFATR